MAHVSHRLKGSFAGALAGGGDPASSPLYVFGPFMRLLAASSAGAACFGAPLWMVAGTVIVVALTYRKVMEWVSDGSGGSGLCEEELGPWAVKVNASITVIEYTLTFLVSIAALVTFAADRFPFLDSYWARTGLAVGLSILTVTLVNRGPRMAARSFGPATLAVLLLLWGLVIAVVLRRGLHLPKVQLEAFRWSNLNVTLGGYVRLLALMTGIEVFANLVAAYDGPPAARARKAFGSLLIVMGTTLVAMLVVGPAIYAVADPSRTDVSVFTQVMDSLLPKPLAYLGSLVGIFVLLSAAAASTQGVQNLAVGLRHRHYVPASFGQRNRFDVASIPAWYQAAIACCLFVGLGTHEETYLSLYAAGVFVLLSLTAFAVVKRMLRATRSGPNLGNLLSLAGATTTFVVTSAAAGLIFFERMRDGAWAYGILIPALYALLSRTRKRLGAPTDIDERIGRVLAKQRSSLPAAITAWPSRILAFLDGSGAAELSLIEGIGLSARFHAPVHICTVGDSGELSAYAEWVGRLLVDVPSLDIPTSIASIADADLAARRAGADLAIANGECPAFRGLPAVLSIPVLVLPAPTAMRHRYTLFERVLVALDGSEAAESVLPYARAMLAQGSTIALALVPDGNADGEVLLEYGRRIAAGLAPDGKVSVEFGGSGPARTLVALATSRDVDLVVVGSHGRGGTDGPRRTALGSVPERLLRDLDRPILVVPVHDATPLGVTSQVGVVRARRA